MNSNYKELCCIIFKGNQYIDTGFTTNQNSGFDLDFVPITTIPTSSNAPHFINSRWYRF